MISRFNSIRACLVEQFPIISYGLLFGFFTLVFFIPVLKKLAHLQAETVQLQWRYQNTLSNIKKTERYETLYHQLKRLYDAEYQRDLITDPALFTQEITQFAEQYALPQYVVEQQDIYRDQSLSISAFTFKASGRPEDLLHFLVLSLGETHPLGIAAFQMNIDKASATLSATYLFTAPNQIQRESL